MVPRLIISAELKIMLNIEYQPPVDEISYTYSMLETLPKPSVFVRNPILVELCGAGFTKAPQSKVRFFFTPRCCKSQPRSDIVL
jgi:DNA ligase-4